MSSDTRKRYRITYTDDGEGGCPEFTQTLRAYDKADAEQRFLDAPDGDGWKIVKIEIVKETPP